MSGQCVGSMFSIKQYYITTSNFVIPDEMNRIDGAVMLFKYREWWTMAGLVDVGNHCVY